MLGLVGCKYEQSVGAAEGEKAPADVAGRWKLPADPAKTDRKHDVWLVIHRTADQQRLWVDYEFEPGKRWYFSGHPVVAKHPEVVELEFLGDSEGRTNEDKRYLLVRWKRNGEALEWGVVDEAKLVDGKGGPELRKALERALDEERVIVGEVQRFTRVVPADD